MPASTDPTQQAAPVVDEEALRLEAEEAEEAERAKKEQEHAAVKQWLGRIEAGRKHDADERKKWKRWRSFMAATPENEDGEEREFLVDAPLLQGVIETTQASIYAKDPDVSVQPEDSVSEQRFEMVRDFCKTLEIVLSRMFRDGDLKTGIKRMSLSAMTNCVGWLKPMLQLDKRSDPLILNQISDMQDNLRRVDRLLLAINDPAQCGDLDALKAELTNQLRALEDKVEVMVARGAVFDYLRPDDVQVDPNCREICDYRMADWIGQGEYMLFDKAMDKFGLDADQMSGAAIYARQDKEGEEPSYSRVNTSPGDNGKGWVRVWEIWDRVASTVHTVIEGVKCYARPPYSPSPVSKRFYPFFCLAFHWIDDRRWPRSDVDLAHKLQEEASRALSNLAEHRRRVRPKTFFNKANLDAEQAKAIQDAENIEMVGLDMTDPGADLARQVYVPAYPQVDPGLYDISVYRQAIEEIFGLQDAARGAVVKPKTATEAGYQDAGRESRMDWRRDAVEGVINEIACYLAELALQAMPRSEAEKYAGPGAMWPELSKEDIYSLVSIAIRGGSSGKPDTKAEREAWATLLPMIQQAVTEIAGLLSNPMTVPLAEVKIELLKETVRRMDDRIDVERFIPKIKPAAVASIPGDPAAPEPLPMAA